MKMGKLVFSLALGKFSTVAEYIDNAVSRLRGQKGSVGDDLQQIRCSAQVNKQTNKRYKVSSAKNSSELTFFGPF